MRIKEKGFTLIELVLIIGLLILTAGVSSDIIITLIRSYNKTQITNEIEQSADFVLLKMERELRDGKSASCNLGNQLEVVNADGDLVTYLVSEGTISRNGVPLTDKTFLGGGVSITCPSRCFTCNNPITGKPVDIVDVDMVFSQTAEANNTAAFIGTVPIKTTIVVRGSY